MPKISVTRGKGVLEAFLAKKRTRLACSLLSSMDERDKLLDIGCGRFPYFLTVIDFRYKVGIDKHTGGEIQSSLCGRDIHFICADLEKNPALPLENESVNAVTLLAVIEHLDIATTRKILSECHRVLTRNGRIVITTPNAWTRPLLNFLAQVGLVSPEEIKEHRTYYYLSLLETIITEAGFLPETIKVGTFECGCNLWGTAQKQS